MYYLSRYLKWVLGILRNEFFKWGNRKYGGFEAGMGLFFGRVEWTRESVEDFVRELVGG